MALTVSVRQHRSHPFLEHKIALAARHPAVSRPIPAVFHPAPVAFPQAPAAFSQRDSSAIGMEPCIRYALIHKADGAGKTVPAVLVRTPAADSRTLMESLAEVTLQAFPVSPLQAVVQA